MEALRPESVNIPESTFDDTLSKAMQARDLLVGASAIVRAQPSTALADLIARARAAASSIVDALEQTMALDAERKRNEQQRLHAQAGKSVSTPEVR